MRRRQAFLLKQIGVDTGSTADGKKMRRIGGWGRELRAWLKDVKFMHQGK
jgi:hypothetical protein